MPTYEFKSKKTEETWEKTLKISELDDYKKKHNCTIVLGTPVISRGVGEVYSRTDGDFKSKMSQIKKDYPSSTSLKGW